eukprot:757766-Hanusia_phi.AAC.1
MTRKRPGRRGRRRGREIKVKKRLRYLKWNRLRRRKSRVVHKWQKMTGQEEGKASEEGRRTGRKERSERDEEER